MIAQVDDAPDAGEPASAEQHAKQAKAAKPAKPAPTARRYADYRSRTPEAKAKRAKAKRLKVKRAEAKRRKDEAQAAMLASRAKDREDDAAALEEMRLEREAEAEAKINGTDDGGAAPAIDDAPLLTPAWTHLREHEQQYAFYTCKKRFILAECGRRSGKSEIAMRIGVEIAMDNPGYSDWLVVFAAPTYAQARHIFWDKVKALVPKWMLASRPLETTMEIKLIHGGGIAVVGMDRPERVEGRIIDAFLCDEFAQYKEGTYARTILPCVSTTGRPGRIILFGVPRPSTQMARLYQEAKNDKRGEWAYFHWTSLSVLTDEEVESVRATMDERTFAQEFLATRVTVAGRAYYPFDRALHYDPWKTLPYNPRGPLVFTLDFNVEPGSANALQEHVGDDGTSYTDVLSEVHIPIDSNTELVCNKLIEQWGNHEGRIHLDGDPAGGARHTAQSGSGGNRAGSDWVQAEKIMRAHFGNRVTVDFLRSAPTQRARVNAFNSRLRTLDKKIHMRFLFGKCDKTVHDCESVQWLKGAAGELDKDSDLSITHWTDGLGYYLNRKFPVEGGGSTTINY